MNRNTNLQRLNTYIAQQALGFNDLTDMIPLFVRMYGPFLAKILYVATCTHTRYIGLRAHGAGGQSTDGTLFRALPCYGYAASVPEVANAGYILENLVRDEGITRPTYVGPKTIIDRDGMRHLFTPTGASNRPRIRLKAQAMFVMSDRIYNDRYSYLEDWPYDTREEGEHLWREEFREAPARFDEHEPSMRGVAFPDADRFSRACTVSRFWC